LIKPEADLKVTLDKDQGGGVIIFHPDFVKKESLSSRNSYRKSAFCAVRDKQDPITCLNKAGKLACVSPEERV